MVRREWRHWVLPIFARCNKRLPKPVWRGDTREDNVEGIQGPLLCKPCTWGRSPCIATMCQLGGLGLRSAIWECQPSRVRRYARLWPCRNPTWKECEDDTHTPENGTWESFGTPKNSEFDCGGQNTSSWGVLYTVGKVLKLRCRKWPRMSHSDICSISYVRKKGRKSNWQFDSGPLNVENRPDAGVCRQSATHRWKVLKESYKFALDLIPIGGLSEELWAAKVPGVQIGIVSR
jgi:hypothetical protein